MLKRTEESKLTNWYFETDRRLLLYVLILIFIGVIFGVSAGSVAAERIGQPWNYFILKAIPFYIGGIATLVIFSTFNRKMVLGMSLLDVAFCLVLLLVTLIAPHEIKGSARFVDLMFFNVMPSDAMKPGFIILTAWFLAKMRELYGENMFLTKTAWRPKLFSWWTYLAIFIPAVLIILNHPDLGTAVLYCTVLCAMLFVAGLPMSVVLGLVALVGVIGVFAFFTMSHVHNRFMAFFTGTGDTYQVTQSVQAIQHGGLLGSGDEAFVKQSLPDAHTDFIFAAIAEDWGALVVCVIIVLLLLVLKRLIVNASNARDRFVANEAGGTAALFGAQVCINLMSTLNLFPPKGMTLPFISYGGTSLLAFCALFGMILALVREDKWK